MKYKFLAHILLIVATALGYLIWQTPTDSSTSFQEPHSIQSESEGALDQSTWLSTPASNEVTKAYPPKPALRVESPPVASAPDLSSRNRISHLDRDPQDRAPRNQGAKPSHPVFGTVRFEDEQVIAYESVTIPKQTESRLPIANSVADLPDIALEAQEQQIVNRLTDDFAQQVEQIPNSNAETPEYAAEFDRLQKLNDDMLRAALGWDRYNTLSTQAAAAAYSAILAEQ